MGVSSPKDVVSIRTAQRGSHAICANSWTIFVQITCLLAVFYQMLARYPLLSAEEAKMLGIGCVH